MSRNDFYSKQDKNWKYYLKSKNTYIGLIVVMVIAALLVIFIPRGPSSEEAVKTVYPPCIDSDKSNDLYLKGVVNYSYGGADGLVLPTQYDSCEGSSLKQVDCSPDGVLVNTIYNCPRGLTCNSGICVPLKCWSEGKDVTLYLYQNSNPCSDRLKQFSGLNYIFPSSANYRCLGVETGVSLVHYSGTEKFPIGYVGKVENTLGFKSLAGICPIEQNNVQHWINGNTNDLEAAKRCVDEGKDNFEFYDPATC